MKVKVVRQYIDKYTGEKHFPGEVLSVSAQRMAELAMKNVIDKIPVPEEPVVEEPEPEKEPRREDVSIQLFTAAGLLVAIAAVLIYWAVRFL